MLIGFRNLTLESTRTRNESFSLKKVFIFSKEFVGSSKFWLDPFSNFLYLICRKAKSTRTRNEGFSPNPLLFDLFCSVLSSISNLIGGCYNSKISYSQHQTTLATEDQCVHKNPQQEEEKVWSF